ncbi:MAG: hypothetical protein AAFU53_04035 [Cyanobacteria bacterium J06632_3]
MDGLRQLLLNHPQNQKVLQFLRVPPDTEWKLWHWRSDPNGPDEGGILFFDTFGAGLPAATKVTLLIHNLMVNPKNGLVFGVHYGRGTFLVRCGLDQAEVAKSDRLRVAETMDGYVDIRELGPPWAFLSCFCEDEPEVLAAAYLRSQAS